VAGKLHREEDKLEDPDRSCRIVNAPGTEALAVNPTTAGLSLLDPIGRRIWTSSSVSSRFQSRVSGDHRSHQQRQPDLAWMTGTGCAGAARADIRLTVSAVGARIEVLTS